MKLMMASMVAAVGLAAFSGESPTTTCVECGESTTSYEDVLKFYSKPITLNGVCWDNSNGEWDFETVYGGVTVKTSAINKNTGAVKVTATISPFYGKKQTATAVAYPDETGTVEDCQLSFNAPIGSMSLWFGSCYCASCAIDYFVPGYRGDAENYVMCDMEMGGSFETDELVFSLDADEFEPELPDGYELLWDLLPFEVPVYVKGGTKLSTDKAPTVKLTKNEDGEYWYDGGIFDDDGELRPNCAGLKISYTPKTGALKGSFKVYAANFEEAKPKLKPYAATVKGLVYDLEGRGVATVKIGKRSYDLNLVLAVPECSFCAE